MKKLVLTGGPCSGKTTVLSVLQEEYGDKIIIVPEVASILLEGGFPVPGKDVEWSQEWQDAFQATILPMQKSFEQILALKAKAREINLLVCDRGRLDGAAYTPGGVEVFCKRFGLDKVKTLAEYDAVVHLESLATVDPERYGKANNANRFEPLERAQELEAATQEAWVDHQKHLVVNGQRGIEGKISEVIGIVKLLLAS